MKKRLLKDSWFQLFTAIAGTACVVSVLGTASTRRGAAPASPPPAAPAAAKSAEAAAPVPAAAAPAPSGPGAEAPITPAPRSSSDLATYSGAGAATGLDLVAPPDPAAQTGPAAGADPSSPPKMTITGTGVGNTQGIVGGSGGGMINGLIGRLMGVPQPQAAMQVQAQPAPLNRVVSARKGVIMVGPPGMAGVDTSSLRDAAFSAASGDLILVKPGTYDGPVEVQNKSVRIRGAGSNPIDVKVIWAGRGATIGVRNGTLDLEKLWIERRPDQENPRTEPGGSVYAIASTLSMRDVDLVSFDAAAPALIVEQGDKPTRVTADGGHLSGVVVDAVIRGPVKAKFTGVFFASVRRPVVAWIDAVIGFSDCSFGLGADAKPEIVAYEGARVTVTGKQKPPIITTRGSDATAIEEMFGAKRAAIARGGFSKDIFRRGRRPGTLP
ncbi:MAG: hypothetical protein PHS14_01055 [Elusimicrobia bacterium]|nr:hypothetical protein [Elusimicrobiota bacterium]